MAGTSLFYFLFNTDVPHNKSGLEYHASLLLWDNWVVETQMCHTRSLAWNTMHVWYLGTTQLLNHGCTIQQVQLGVPCKSHTWGWLNHQTTDVPYKLSLVYHASPILGDDWIVKPLMYYKSSAGNTTQVPYMGTTESSNHWCAIQQVWLGIPCKSCTWGQLSRRNTAVS